jgi:hypothetical protein
MACGGTVSAFNAAHEDAKNKQYFPPSFVSYLSDSIAESQGGETDGFPAVDVFEMFKHGRMKSRIASGHRQLVPVHLEVTDSRYLTLNRCRMGGLTLKIDSL